MCLSYPIPSPVAMLAALFFLAPQSIQETTIEERVQKVVDQEYGDVTQEKRGEISQRIIAALSHPRLTGDSLEAFIGQLGQAIRYARAHASFYNPRYHGDKIYPPLPESLASRVYEAEVRYLETYLKDGIETRPLGPADRHAIIQQIDYLLGHAKGIMTTKVLGPY